jgi:long-chain fatty acid transport protein
VLASGFQLVEQNASGLGNAYAGQAAGVDDASAAFFNPANLARLPGKQIVVAGNPIGIGTRFVDSGSTGPFLPTSPPLALPVPLGGSGGDAGGWVPVPNAYFSWQAGRRVWVGLGLNAPFGLKTEWDPGWAGRFKAIKSEVRTVNINPNVAFKVGERLSLGAGVSYQRMEAELSQAVAYGGISAGIARSVGGMSALQGIVSQLGGPGGLAREGASTVKGDTWSVGWNVGATVDAWEGGRIAATYRSAIEHDVEGDALFEGAPTFATAGPLGPLGAALNARFASGPVTTKVELPQTLSIAALHEARNVAVLADWTWTGWSSIQDLTISRADGTMLNSVPLTFQDTWRVGLGVTWRVDDNWKLRVGTAFDKAPVQDRYRTPRLPDEDRTWAAAGFQYKLSKAGAVDFGYAHLFVKDATSGLANQDAPTAAPSGSLVGSYKLKVDILSIQYRHSF